MAKATKKVELTEAERLTKEKEIGLERIQEKLDNISSPTYFFKKGDKVKFGGLEESIIDEVFYDGKIYGVIGTKTKKFGFEEKKVKTYHVVAWVDVRPITNGDTNFTQNKDLRLNFLNSDIRSLLGTYYGLGIDMNPDYQRDYVWTMEDKVLLIDSVFKNIDIGKFVLVNLPFDKYVDINKSYEILDGKQRLSTLVEFYENRFPYQGKYYNDLSREDKMTFNNLTIAVANLQDSSKRTILKYFLLLNRTGRRMEETHLQNVEKMLEKL